MVHDPYIHEIYDCIITVMATITGNNSLSGHWAGKYGLFVILITDMIFYGSSSHFI